jgi:hypothetical protein
MSVQLQIFFEDPFWIGLFSAIDNDGTEVCRVVFGKEPTDAEVYHYLRKNFYQLKFIESESLAMHTSHSVNPKRRQRQISRELHDNIGVKKSYEIIKQSISQNAGKAKRMQRKIEKENHSDYVLELKRVKRREKHKGH